MANDNDLASIQRTSTNRKLAPVKLEHAARSLRKRPVAQGPFVTSTYVNIDATCPDTCAFKNNGCYVQEGWYGGRKQKSRYAREAMRSRGMEAMEREAALIDAMYSQSKGVPQDGRDGEGRPMRLHVAGDATCADGAELLAGAAKRWRERGGGPVWTYTHRWATIPREAWGSISVLASCEMPSACENAVKRGYAAAITLPYFPSDRAFRLPDTKLTVVPCPAETRGRTCVECRLCFEADKLRERGQVIGFAVHGRGRTKAAKRLNVLQSHMLDALPLELRG